jgi:hypothetical protein
MNLNSPIPPEWGSYVTQSPVGLEVVPFHLWDTEPYLGGTTTSLDLFKNVQGKNLQQTNMKQGGSLANPEAMLIQNIRVLYENTVQSDDGSDEDSSSVASQFNDIIQLSVGGVGTLKIGNKIYGPWLLWTLPVANFVKGGFSDSDGAFLNYGQVDGPLYPLFPNLMIAPLQPFVFSIEWPNGAVTLSQDGFESPESIPIKVLFDGQLARAIQ